MVLPPVQTNSGQLRHRTLTSLSPQFVVNEPFDMDHWHANDPTIRD
jgi:hypothetical protein